MTIKEFIEKAIEGGWKYGDCAVSYELTYKDIPEIVLLDPLAWQAVGKMERWKKTHTEDTEGNYDECWICKMHRMIDALIEQKTLEQYISTL